jgi:hypothetical protein
MEMVMYGMEKTGIMLALFKDHKALQVKKEIKEIKAIREIKEIPLV